MLKKIFFHLLPILVISIAGKSQITNDASIEIVTQEKIQGIITILAYSPDGSLIASGSEKENTIKVWDVKSGKIIGKLEGHEDETTALCFNADGTALISAAMDNRVMLWNLIDWSLIDSTRLIAPVTAFCVNPKTPNSFYAGGITGQVQSWNPNDFQHPKNLYKHEKRVNVIDVSDKHLVSGTKSGEVSLFDLSSKTKLLDQKIHNDKIMGLNFFNNGAGVISAGENGRVIFWDVQQMTESRRINTSATNISAYGINVEKNIFVTAAKSGTIKIWNLDGEQIQTFKSKSETDGVKQPIKAIEISPDGTTLASSGYRKVLALKSKESKNVIRVWDLKRGALYKTLEGTVNPIYTFDFHPTKNQLVSLGENNTLTFWDFNLAEKYGSLTLEETERKIASFRRPKDETVSDEEKVEKDIEKGKKFKSILDKAAKGDFSGVTDEVKDKVDKHGATAGVGFAKRMFKERSIVKYSEKGSYLITKIKKDELRLYEFESGKPNYKQIIYSYQFSINQLLTSPDEKYLAVIGGGDSAVSIVDLETKLFVKKLPTPAPKDNFKFIYEANSLAFSPDGSLLAVCFNTGKTFVYNTSNWSMAFQNEIKDDLGYVKSPFVNFSKDGKFMVLKSKTGLIKYDTKTFNPQDAKPLQINGFSVPMDKPEDYAITIKDDYIYFEDLFTGKVNKSVHISPKQITNISINTQGLVGITFSSGQFQLLNPKTGEEEVLLVAEGDNYIFKTAENYYKVSKEGYDLVTFRIGNQAFPFEQFDAIFNRPDLVLKKMGCTDTELMSLYEKAYLKRVKKLGLEPTSNIVLADIPKTDVSNVIDIPAITDKNSINLNAQLLDKKGLKSYNIWVNNVPVHGKKGKKITGVNYDVNEDIPLVYGLNKIQIACQNASGYESLIQTFYVEKEGVKPDKNLFLVTIGTSNYKDTRYNLTYPVKDAQDLVGLMATGENSLYKEVKSKSLFNEDVTAENVSNLREFLMGSKPNDVVIVFVAGHGVLDANFDYYFGTHDIDFSNPATNGLAYEKLERILDGIKANKKILIMDTCHSGEVDKEDVFFDPDQEDQEENDDDIAFRSSGDKISEDKSKATPTRLAGELFNDLRKGTGATVISSAGGVEFAMESDEWKNGLFTYCMLNGLKNRTADLDGDGTIMLLELQAYVVDKVRALSHGRQVPNSRIQNIELDFQIW